MPKLLFSLLAFPWVAGPASATLLELKGDFVQGGLVLGRTDPATKISLDGDPVAVTPDGRFVLGFGWVSGNSDFSVRGCRRQAACANTENPETEISYSAN